MRFSSLLATDQLDISFTVTGAHQQKYHSVGHKFSKATDQGGIDFTSQQGLSNRGYFCLQYHCNNLEPISRAYVTGWAW